MRWHEFRVRVGGRVRKARHARGLTQQQLADRIGVNRTLITNLELGNQGTILPVFSLLCQVLGVSADSLLGLSPMPELS